MPIYLQYFCIFISLVLSNLIQAAPIDTQTGKVESLKVEFALLYDRSSNALSSESWNNVKELRDEVKAALKQLESQTKNNLPSNSDSQSPEDSTLINKLSALIESNRFDLVTSTQWLQPRTQKRYTQKLSTPLNEFAPFDFVFGTLRLEERRAFVAKLDMNLIERASLNPQSTNRSEIDQSIDSFQNDQIIEKSLDEREKAFAINSQMRPSPIIFIHQQRQVRLDQVHYFDHPVTPGFILVTKQEGI